jgi:hypothetical protein
MNLCPGMNQQHLMYPSLPIGRHPSMNWRRVCIFVLIFFAATAAAAFPFEFIRDFSIVRGQVPPS